VIEREVPFYCESHDFTQTQIAVALSRYFVTNGSQEKAVRLLGVTFRYRSELYRFEQLPIMLRAKTRED
jgi:hypothetical protein